jgi:hypothetical protein
MRSTEPRPTLTVVRVEQDRNNGIDVVPKVAGAEEALRASTPPADARMAVPEPLRAPQPWVQAVEAAIDWYTAMFGLAFGIGQVSHPPQRPNAFVASSAASPEVAQLQSTSPPGSRTEPQRRATVPLKKGRLKETADRGRSVNGARRRKAKPKTKSRYGNRRAA